MAGSGNPVPTDNRRRTIAGLMKNADALAPLLIGVTVTVLGALNLVHQDVVDNAILACLAVLAFALLRDRWGEEATKQAIMELRLALPAIPVLERSIRRMETAVDELATVKTLKGKYALEPVFADAREHTRSWTFKGGTGSYTRAMTLPKCVDLAKQSNPRRQLTFHLEILDPANVELCQRYAAYRASLPSSAGPKSEPWDVERVQKEAYATVLAAGVYMESYSLLDVYVYLASTMSTFRYDLSDTSVIITQDDADFPAMVISNNNPAYHAHFTELKMSREQARPLDIRRAHAQLSQPLDNERVRHFFEEAGIPLPNSFTQGNIAEIIERTINPKNPFETTASRSGAVHRGKRVNSGTGT
jgi:hypothetical protein